MTTKASTQDVLAGLSIAGLLLPEAVAYSGLANLPPQAGVIALFAGLVCYGLIGRSAYAIVAATSSSAAVLASATLTLGGADLTQRIAYAGILVAGAGVAFLLAAWLRLGVIANLIARPVLRGFTFGLALVITVKQWPHLAALTTHASDFFPLLGETLRGWREWQPTSLACGLAALAGLFLLERLPRVPGALVVILLSIAASGVLAAHGVKLTGPIHLVLGMPVLTVPADLRWRLMVEFSLALMFILYAESYGSIRTYALRHDERVEPNRDLFALGIANLVAGLFNANPVGAGYSATSANEAAGARSRFAGLAAAAVVLVAVLLFLPWIERIPEPALAAIVIHAVSKSLRPSVFRNYMLWHRDRLLALASVLSVLLFGIMNGLLVAIGLSILMLVRSFARPRLAVLGRVGEHDYVSTERFPDAETLAHLLVLRPEEPVFFANAEPLMNAARAHVERQPQARLLVLSLEESPNLDSTTLEELGDFCSWLDTRRVELRLARLKEGARRALLRAGIAQLHERTLDYSSVDDAVRGECVTPAPRHPA
jgi:MFS superfamily sulfate permease-like transporter